MNRYLIVVDVQKDFVDGALGSKEAAAIVKPLLQKVESFDGTVIFTMDTHGEDYLSSREGRLLPVQHCIRGTDGWLLWPELSGFARRNRCRVYEKPTFGSIQLAQDLLAIHREQPIDCVTLVGLCTDICVVSNALLLKAYLPEVEICVDSSCCAGVTVQKHEAALETMRSCQIVVE